MKKKFTYNDLTPMQQFILDHFKAESGEHNPNYIAQLWRDHKKQPFHCASRDTFGSRSAAYKAMRKLRDMKLLNSRDDYKFFLTEKGQQLK